jgi:hypothetical protein
MTDQNRFIEHVAGSLERPMSDGDLEAKFHGLVDGVLAPARARQLLDACWKVEALPAAGHLAGLAAAS